MKRQEIEKALAAMDRQDELMDMVFRKHARYLSKRLAILMESGFDRPEAMQLLLSETKREPTVPETE